jgi:tricorn protease interacting factor F2/3
MTLRVDRYDLFLDVSFESLKFDGKLLMTLESTEDFVLDSVGLRVSDLLSDGRTLPFERRDDHLVVKSGPFEGTLEIQYSGEIPSNLAGIYKAPYDSTYIITTDFEAANARRMLPCADRPDCKAEFKLTVRTDKDLDAISNMPVESVKVGDGKKVVAFQKTPKMSTYLLYLGIGKFEQIKERLGGKDVIVAGTPGKARNGEFALQFSTEALKFFESYFGTPYVLPKIHLIGVPEFAAGAMENWGAVTFRETALYVNGNSSFVTRKNVAQIVAHELAHQWFGNLVTMKWWNDLWLNESFATLMGYKVVNERFPDWNAWQDFLIEETSQAMSMDSLRNTHPIEADVKSPDDIQEIFDAITYGKGASILRMIEAYIGVDEFRKGVQNYLERHRFSNAAGIDLWNSMDECSGKPVGRIMTEWVCKPGHPVVTVKIDGDKIVLRQERFLLSGEPAKTIWPIPITMKVSGKPRTLLLDKEEGTMRIENLTSLQVNSDRTGFYRVQYEEGLDHLVWASGLSAPDRWGIAFDAMAFLLAGRISFADYLGLVERYSEERDYLPAREISDQLAFLYSIVESRIAGVTRGFHKSQLASLRNKADEISSMMRGIVSTRLAMVDDDYAAELGSGFNAYESVEPDMRQAVAVGYARMSGDFELIAKKYRESTSDEERERLLVSMTAFKEPRQLSKLFELVQHGEVKKQDQLTIVSAATRNPHARDVAWVWVTSSMPHLREIYESTGDISRLLQSCIPILGIDRVDEVEEYFEENRVPEAQSGINAGLEKLRIHQKLVNSISNQA